MLIKVFELLQNSYLTESLRNG